MSVDANEERTSSSHQAHLLLSPIIIHDHTIEPLDLPGSK